MNTAPYDRMHHNINEVLALMRAIRVDTIYLSEKTVRVGRIKAASWTVERVVDKLSHTVYLHQKQTRRAEGG